MNREKTTYRFQTQPLNYDEQQPLDEWLSQQIPAGSWSWLLAHATDGVIWGWANERELHISNEAAPTASPPLRRETLQQLRLFNPDSEVRLWHDGFKWCAIRVTDSHDETAASIDEPQLLWGTYATQLEGGFIWLEDGNQGLVHIIPPFDQSEKLKGELGMPDDETVRRVYLGVRHYLTEDESGVNAITMSRLVNVGV